MSAVGTVTRYALVRNARDRDHAEAYLPDNYEVIHEAVERNERFSSRHGAVVRDELVFVIAGRDAYGWTLDDYVIPRYASGLIWVEEIDLSHPVMKEIPA